MPERRTVLQAAGSIAGTALIGLGGVTGSGPADGSGPPEVDSMASALEYVRNVEEVRGHLTSSANLLGQGRRDDAALHAGHPQDYFATILPPLRDRDPGLATRVRATLKTPTDRVQSMAAGQYRGYLNDEVMPVLDRVVETVVPSDLRGSTAFDARLMNALAGRIAGEYGAAVPSAGTVELVGEYWDARGFLVRIEHRHEQMDTGLGVGDTLSRLRTALDDVAAPGDVRELTLQFRVETTAAAGLPGATVEGRDDAVEYVRNVEEVRGHLIASSRLAVVGDDHATLHSGHPSDYVTTILPPVHAVNTDLAETLFEQMVTADDRVASTSPGNFEQFVTGEVFPQLDRAVSVAVPDEYSGSSSFHAAVFLALGDRIVDEYDAAVTDQEVIELYGEYWDGRGFLNRMEALLAGFESDLDGETRSAVRQQLGTLREEIETAAVPKDVAGSVDSLRDHLGEFAEV